MQVTRSIEERPCLTWPHQGPVGPSGFFKEPRWTLPAEGRPVRSRFFHKHLGGLCPF